MFNLGFSEMILVGVIALVFIGPKQLPEIARVLGRMINEFKKATSDLSGGLLDIKNDLREPFEEGLQAVEKIRSDIANRTEEFVNSTKNLDQMNSPVPRHSSDHSSQPSADQSVTPQENNRATTSDDKTAEIKTENDPEKA